MFFNHASSVYSRSSVIQNQSVNNRETCSKTFIFSKIKSLIKKFGDDDISNLLVELEIKELFKNKDYMEIIAKICVGALDYSNKREHVTQVILGLIPNSVLIKPLVAALSNSYQRENASYILKQFPPSQDLFHPLVGALSDHRQQQSAQLVLNSFPPHKDSVNALLNGVFKWNQVNSIMLVFKKYHEFPVLIDHLVESLKEPRKKDAAEFVIKRLPPTEYLVHRLLSNAPYSDLVCRILSSFGDHKGISSTLAETLHDRSQLKNRAYIVLKTLGPTPMVLESVFDKLDSPFHATFAKSLFLGFFD